MRSIGRAARKARRARKLTQEDVADRVGVSTQFYGRIERGYALPSVTTLRRMLDVLDLRADELLGVTGTEPASDDDAATQARMEAENPHLRRLMRYLRRASPVTLQVVKVLLDEIEKAEALLQQERAARRARRTGAAGPPGAESAGGDEGAAGGDAGAGGARARGSGPGDPGDDPDAEPGGDSGQPAED